MADVRISMEVTSVIARMVGQGRIVILLMFPAILLLVKMEVFVVQQDCISTIAPVRVDSKEEIVKKI